MDWRGGLPAWGPRRKRNAKAQGNTLPSRALFSARAPLQLRSIGGPGQCRNHFKPELAFELIGHQTRAQPAP